MQLDKNILFHEYDNPNWNWTNLFYQIVMSCLFSLLFMNEINKIYFCILLLKIFIRLGIIYIIYLEILSFTKSSEYRNAFAWCAHLMRSQKCQQLCVTLFWLSWFHLNEKKKIVCCLTSKHSNYEWMDVIHFEEGLPEYFRNIPLFNLV